eukprot:2219345-Amphidinium_carterae.2
MRNAVGSRSKFSPNETIDVAMTCPPTGGTFSWVPEAAARDPSSSSTKPPPREEPEEVWPLTQSGRCLLPLCVCGRFDLECSSAGTSNGTRSRRRLGVELQLGSQCEDSAVVGGSEKETKGDHSVFAPRSVSVCLNLRPHVLFRGSTLHGGAANHNVGGLRVAQVFACVQMSTGEQLAVKVTAPTSTAESMRDPWRPHGHAGQRGAPTRQSSAIQSCSSCSTLSGSICLQTAPRGCRIYVCHAAAGTVQKKQRLSDKSIPHECSHSQNASAGRYRAIGRVRHSRNVIHRDLKCAQALH